MNKQNAARESRDPMAPSPVLDEVVIERLIGPRRRGGVPTREILSRCGGLAGLAVATPHRLESAGLGRREAELISAAMELSRCASRASPTGPLDRSAVVAMLQPQLEILRHEEMHAVFMGADGSYLGRALIAKGGSDSVSMHIRDVLGPAVEARACRLVLAHNHPSGRCAPSPEDVTLSARVDQAAPLLGIRLIDHFVFARDGVASAMPDGPHWPVPARTRGAH